MEETRKATEGQSRSAAPLALDNASNESGRAPRVADCPVLERTLAKIAAQTAERLNDTDLFAKPAPHASLAKSPTIQLYELDNALDGVEITRLPWGYAVTRKTRTP